MCVCAGVPTPVAQSRIQECLSQLSEADYNCIMSEYKVCYSVYSSKCSSGLTLTHYIMYLYFMGGLGHLQCTYI